MRIAAPSCTVLFCPKGRTVSVFQRRFPRAPTLLAAKEILGHTGKDRTMIEIGCGTGKFTLPMLAEARHVHAIDLSPHMLKKLSEKIIPDEKHKITLIQAKWEASQTHAVDCIYCVNALYRMREIKKALHKMNRDARRHVVIVWTMQRSVFDTFINSFHKTGLERNQEYIHLMALLYEMGIDAELEFIEASKPMTMGKQETHEQLKHLAITYDLPMQKLFSLFHESVTIKADKYFFQCPSKVALIHWTPCS